MLPQGTLILLPNENPFIVSPHDVAVIHNGNLSQFIESRPFQVFFSHCSSQSRIVEKLKSYMHCCWPSRRRCILEQLRYYSSFLAWGTLRSFTTKQHNNPSLSQPGLLCQCHQMMAVKECPRNSIPVPRFQLCCTS